MIERGVLFMDPTMTDPFNLGSKPPALPVKVL